MCLVCALQRDPSMTPIRVLAAVAVTLLVLCAAPTRGAEAAPHRHAAKHATAKHATATAKPKTKRATAARHAKSAPTRSADEATDEPETKPQRTSEPKPDPVATKPAMPGGAVSQAEDSEEPPVRQRAKR